MKSGVCTTVLLAAFSVYTVGLLAGDGVRAQSLSADAAVSSRGLESVLPDSGPLLTRIIPNRKMSDGLPVDVYTFAPFEWGWAAVSPTSSFIANAGHDGVCIWWKETSRQIRCYRVPTGPLVFDKVGRHLLVAKGPSGRNQIEASVYNLWRAGPLEESLVTLIPIDDNMPASSLKAGYGEAFSIATSSDGSLLYVGHNNKIAVWDVSNQRVVQELPCSGVAFAIYPQHNLGLCSKDFANFLAANQMREASDYTIHAIHLSRNDEAGQFRGATQPVTAAEITNEGTILYSASRDGRIREYDIGSGRLRSVMTVVSKPKVEFQNSVGDRIEGIGSMVLIPGGNAAVTYEYQGHSNSEHSQYTTTRLWDLQRGAEVRDLQEAERLLAIFDPVAKTIIATGGKNNEGRVISVEHGAVVRRYEGWASDLRDVRALGGTKIFYAAETRGLLVNLDNASAVPLLDMREHSKTFSSREGNRVVAIDAVGSRDDFNSRESILQVTSYEWRKGGAGDRPLVTKFNISSKRKRKVFFRGDYYTGDVGLSVTSLSPDGGLIATISEDDALEVWDAGNGTRLIGIRHNAWSQRPLNSFCGLGDAIISPDRHHVLSLETTCNSFREGVGSGRARVWDLSSGKEVVAFDLKGVSKAYFSSELGAPAFSPDGNRFALLTEEVPHPLHRPAKAVLQVFSFQRLLLSKPIDVEMFGSRLYWSADGREVIIGGNAPRQDSRHYEYMTPATRRVIRVLTTDGSISGSQDMEGAPSGAGDAGACSEIFRVRPDVKLAVDCRAILDGSTGKRLASFFPLAGGAEWMLMTPEGFYSSSENAHQYVNMRRGNAVYGAEQLYDVFYRPDLVIRKLRGEDISGDGKLLTIDQALANPPPVTEVLAVEPKGRGGGQEVRFRLQGKGGGIGEVRVFHNRKLVHREDAQVHGEGSFEGRVKLQGVAGENEVTVMGMNRQNSVQGMMRNRSFSVAGETGHPQAYVLAVGIDKYRSGKDNLTFAVSDAQRLAAALDKGLGSLYRPENVHIEIVADAQATREGLLARFVALKERVHPGDQFILFVASHGLLLGGKYYIVAHDYDGTFDPSKGLSSEELMEASREISSLNQLLIFDTCHAGGMDQTVTATYDARMSVLARQMGLHVFAAASSLQQAVEGYEGSGAFTHALLEALSQGAPADTNRDGVVSVAELGAYAKHRTEIIAQSFGYHQIPRIINVGQDKGLYRFDTGPQVAMVGGADTGALAQRAVAVPLRITTGAGVYLRSAPNRTAAKRLLLHFGAIVTLLGEDTQGEETWSRVSMVDGEGWIPATYLSEYTQE